ncbi:MAG: hypothetical protein Q9225_002855 [Loekoesia sp. 1 TL-2023]
MASLPPGMDPSKIPIAPPPSPGELTVVQAFYGPTIFFTKLCLFILYYRLFSPSNIMRYLIYFGVVFNSVFYVIYLFLYIFLCPNSKKDQSCESDLKTLGIATAAINVADDFYILFIPLSAISNLQLPPMRKLGLLAIFFTGFLTMLTWPPFPTHSACLCSIVSLHLRVVLNRENDDVWNAVPVIVVGTVEFNIGIICSCLPTLPALFRRSNFFSRKTANKQSYNLAHDSGNSAGVARSGGAAEGGRKKGFGRLGDVEESKDSVAGLEAGMSRDGNGNGNGNGVYETGGFEGEEDGRKKEWFRQARM